MLESQQRLNIAIQKSGRLNSDSLQLLRKCGLNFEYRQNKLRCRCENFPLDVFFVRDDDIPQYVKDGVCQLGIVGKNVFMEDQLAYPKPNRSKVQISLGFGRCRLSLASPENDIYTDLSSFNGKRIATSYPWLLGDFSKQHKLHIHIVKLAGSVEIAPSLGIADVICDLVSTGATIELNGLQERATVLNSEALLIRTTNFPKRLERSYSILLKRIEGVKKSNGAKYIMMNAPKTSIEKIEKIISGIENLSIMELHQNPRKVAIHAMTYEEVFWETMEQLQSAGATSILVLPIEKRIE